MKDINDTLSRALSRLQSEWPDKEQVPDERPVAHVIIRIPGAPFKLYDCAISNYDAYDENKKQAVSIARQFDRLRTVIWLGPVGVGKSHLAHGMARYWARLHTHASYEWITHGQLYQRVLGAYNGGRPYVERMRSLGLLVIDEIEIPRNDDDRWNLRILIQTRMDNDRATIMTSNLTNEGLRGVLGGRIMDRMKDRTCKLFTLTGESWRGRK